ncbi:hypothetical protein Tco_0571344 [Tanacetum coccineum]
MELCTNLQQRVLDLETTKTTQANEIASLKRRVKKLEKKDRSRTHKLKRLYKVSLSTRVESSKDEGLGEEDASKHGRIFDIDANKDIYLVNVHTDEDMFGVNNLDGDEVIVSNVDVVKTTEEIRSVVEEVTVIIEKAKLVSVVEETVNVAATTVSTASTIPVSAATTTTTTTFITDDEITLAKALAELKSAKLPTQGIAFRKSSESITTTPTFTTTTAATTITTASTRPKDKGIVIHEQEQEPTLTVSSQQPSQVKVQDKGKGKMVEPEPIKKMSKKDLLRLDEELAFKLKAEKEEEEERLAREKAQQIEEVNIAWDDVQAKIEADYQLAQRLQAQEQEELTDEEKARLFVQFLEQRRKHFTAKRLEEKRNRPSTRAQQRSIMCTYLKNIEGWKPKSLKNKSFANIQELFEKAMKRAGEELEQENSKNQKVEEDKEFEKLKQCLEIVSDDGDDVTIDATHLSIKSSTIMLKNFDREDLKVLWSIVKARFKKTDPVNYMDNLTLHHLKTMFEHHVEDNVWKNQQGLVKVLNWKLYDSFGFHCVTMQSIPFYLLVEKIYPLTNYTLHQMFNDVKLQVDYECEMAFELLRLVKKQLKEGYGRIVGIKSLLEVTAAKKWDPTRGILQLGQHALKSLKKYGMETCDPANTPMVEKSKLDEDP